MFARPFVQFFLDQIVDGVVRHIVFRHRPRCRVRAVKHEVHGLLRPLLGSHPRQLVLNRYVSRGGQIKSHVKFLQRAPDLYHRLEIHQTGILAVVRHAGADGLRRRDVYVRIHQIPFPLHVIPVLNFEFFCPDDRQSVRNQPARKHVTPHQPGVAQRIQGIGQLASPLNGHPILVAAGEQHVHSHRRVYFHGQQQVKARRLQLFQRVGLVHFQRVLKRHEPHHLLALVAHFQRR